MRQHLSPITTSFRQFAGLHCAKLAILFLTLICAPLLVKAETFIVLNTSDSGPGSLRQAVQLANSNGVEDLINFDPTFFSTPQTITLTSGEIVVGPEASLITMAGPGASLLTIS